jgi:DNA-binding response OmpR family regulator
MQKVRLQTLAQSVQPSVALKQASGESSPSPSIMVIDDSPTIRKVIETALNREGYLTITFPDGMSAFRWLAQASDSVPGLILLDIILPKMDGYAIARALKAKPAWEDMTILMMSRHN